MFADKKIEKHKFQYYINQMFLEDVDNDNKI